MARFKAGIKTRNGSGAAFSGSKPSFNPIGSKMNASQTFKLGKMQQRTTRKAINKAAENIRAAGEAVSGVTTPFAANMATKTIAEQRTARKRIESQLPTAWNNLIDGNPDKDTGSDPNTSSGSSTTSMLGG